MPEPRLPPPFWGDLSNIILGTGKANILNGSEGSDLISGESGGESSNVWLYGGSGNDTLNGGEGSDQLDGGNGNDWAYGSSENDTLFSGSGDDKLFGNGGRDMINAPLPTTTSSASARAQSPNHTRRRERYPLLHKIEYRIWWRRYPLDFTNGVDKITLAKGIDFKFVDGGKAIISKAAGQAHVNDHRGESEQSDLKHYGKIIARNPRSSSATQIYLAFQA